jgi:phosphoribosylamine--glycine ligase
MDGIAWFWGGSKLADGRVNAAGGRVLTVTARGPSIGQARERVYAACSAYSALLPPAARLRYRSDIAQRAASG